MWKPFLEAVLPFFQNQPLELVIDLTPYEEYAQIVYLELLHHSRVLPIAWKVMPGQTKWDQGLWDLIEGFFKHIHPYLEKTDCTIIGDSAFGCFAMVTLCEKYAFHYLFRIGDDHTCERWSPQGRRLPTCRVGELVSEPGKKFYAQVRLWQDNHIETNLSGIWEEGQEKALLVISDRPAGKKRISQYKRRWKVESTFEDMKSRGWDWEESHVRRGDRVDRLLLVLFLLLWWLAHLAASCIHNRRSLFDFENHEERFLPLFRLFAR